MQILSTSLVSPWSSWLQFQDEFAYSSFTKQPARPLSIFTLWLLLNSRGKKRNTATISVLIPANSGEEKVRQSTAPVPPLPFSFTLPAMWLASLPQMKLKCKHMSNQTYLAASNILSNNYRKQNNLQFVA